MVRCAAVHRPQQLKVKVLLMLEALVVHHQALLCRCMSEVQDISESNCADCLACLPEVMAQITAISGDLGVLQSLHDQLRLIDCDFPRADPPFFKAAADMVKELANDVDVSDARGRFEQLLSHPTTTDET